MAKSPSIILTEIDESSYAITTSDTILAIVGYATKGPIGEATLTTSRNEFIEKFGPPPQNAPWSSLAAYRAFNQGNQILFKRVAEESGSNAAVGAERCITNASPASAGYQEFTQATSVAFGSYTAQEVYDLRLEIDNSGIIRDVYIISPSSGDWTLSDIATQINTQITSDTSGFQEWEINLDPSITASAEYRFNVGIDGAANIAGGGAGGIDLSAFLDPGDALSVIATEIQTAMENGSNGYQRWHASGAITGASATGLVVGETYGLRINVDGGGDTDIQIVGSANTATYSQLITVLQNEIDTALLNAKSYFDIDGTGNIRIQSDARGIASTIAVTDDTTAGAPNGGIFAKLDAAGGFDVAVAGAVGLVAAGNYTVAVNAYTGRIRITSVSTGTSSEIDISVAQIGNQLSTLLTSILEANDGELAAPGGATATATVNGTSNLVRVTSDLVSSSSDITLTEGTGTDNAKLVALLGLETAIAGTDAVLEANTDNILFKALEKGTDTNNISIVKSSRINPVDSSTVHKIEVYYGATLKETFDEISLTIGDTNFFVTLINADPANNGSEWIEVEYENNGVDTTLEFPNGTYYLGINAGSEDEYQTGDVIGDYDVRIGTDGIPSSGGSSLFVTALSIDGDMGNIEEFDYHILITPDNGAETTQNAAITLAEYRKDFIYIVDTPFGLEYDEAADWHNGSGSHGRNTAINSSYAACYWPWLKDYNSTEGEYVWSPPSVFLAEKYMQVDRTYGPWYACAGDSRGKIIAYDYETSPSFAQREILYGDFNAINPIVNFISKGLEIYGQKTLLRENSSLNRVNVRRMVIYAKKLIRRAMEGVVFEPHNADSWARATNLINAILEPIRQANGLDNYRVTIDSSTNTPDVIAQNIMKGIIKLVPVGTIEIIDLTITIYSAGATIE